MGSYRESGEEKMIYFIGFIFSLALAALFVPLVKRFAFKVGAVDRPSTKARKIHTRTMARGGGIAIFLSFLLVSVAIIGFHWWQFWGLIVASAIVMLLGLADDIKRLPAKTKLLVQILAALVAIVVFGIQIEGISNPISQGVFVLNPNLSFYIASLHIQLNLFAVVLTTIWLVGMTNTMNFVDGIDGLSGGIAAIAAVVMFFLAVGPKVDQPSTALIAIVLAGGCLGYLIYNFHPAKIFNGDSGAYFLGMALGILAIFSGAKLATAALVLGVPILDAVWAALRRILAGRSPFSADRGHLHHLLLDVGLSQRQAALLIYALCAIFGGIALIASPTQKLVAIFALVILIMLMFLLLSLILRRKTKKNLQI
jgi:UDP-GlcNAc:undecaprenyl-phosphate GlcNAc-1-phosphate transferase